MEERKEVVSTGLTDPESSEDNAILPHLDKGAFLPLFLPT